MNNKYIMITEDDAKLLSSLIEEYFDDHDKCLFCEDDCKLYSILRKLDPLDVA